MNKPRVIKRYKNRKLYDVAQSKYTTLMDLAGLIQAGENLVVIDQRDQRDITSQVLSHVVVSIQDTSQSYSIQDLSNFIKKGA